MSDGSFSLKLSSEGKSLVIAYLLWWFFGYLGFHRLYLERPKSAIAFMVLFGLGFVTLFLAWIPLGIWWLCDAYFVYQYTKDKNASFSLLMPSEFSLRTNFSTPNASDKPVSKEAIETLGSLHNLYEKGVISEGEYETQKKKILDSL